jgi:hypothetical protein
MSEKTPDLEAQADFHPGRQDTWTGTKKTGTGTELRGITGGQEGNRDAQPTPRPELTVVVGTNTAEPAGVVGSRPATEAGRQARTSGVDAQRGPGQGQGVVIELFRREGPAIGPAAVGGLKAEAPGAARPLPRREATAAPKPVRRAA